MIQQQLFATLSQMAESRTCYDYNPRQPFWQVVLHVIVKVACEGCLQLSDGCNQESQPEDSKPIQAYPIPVRHADKQAVFLLSKAATNTAGRLLHQLQIKTAVLTQTCLFHSLPKSLGSPPGCLHPQYS